MGDDELNDLRLKYEESQKNIQLLKRLAKAGNLRIESSTSCQTFSVNVALKQTTSSLLVTVSRHVSSTTAGASALLTLSAFTCAWSHFYYCI